MSYQYRIKAPPKDGSFAFSFPCMDAELSGNVVKSSKIGPALNRIAKQLMKQYSKHDRRGDVKDIVGIEFHTIGFTFILDDTKSRKAQAQYRKKLHRCPTCNRNIKVDPLSSAPIFVWHYGTGRNKGRECPKSFGPISGLGRGIR